MTIPFDAAKMVGLPVNNLTYRVRVPQPLTQEEIDARITALTTVPTPVPPQARFVIPRCIRTTTRTTLLYAGPGTFHEVIRELRANTRIYPVLRLTDTGDVTWWQLNNGHWMLASRAESEGNCGEIPVTEIVAPPTYNHLLLETCDTDNGPVRAGQYVTIEFVAGSWKTQSEALTALRVDPGRITTNEERHYVRVSDPFEVSEDRWYRSFTTQWYAQPGTYRIVGNRAHYTVICDITVPLG
jgi:hypothetical protein